ncbi:carbohydrate-binding protein [Micromonospora deserti]|nr:carbohydrate-binding protein [Micromonospora deserti]
MKSLIGATTVLVLLVAMPMPTAHAAPTRYEAENAVCDGTIDSNHSGFSGSGFCNSINATGVAVQFTVNAASAGTATLGVRYANGGTTDRLATVNGGATVSFPSTGAWNTWSTATTTIQVNAGTNTIRLAATTAAGLANIDYLDVEVGGPNPPTGRKMERLGRGVVAVRSSSTDVLVTWRLLGLDPDGIGFNVYRSAAGGTAVRLNSSILTGGANFVDRTADLTRSNAYHVRPVIGGVEQAPSGSFTLTANRATEPVVRVPLRAGGPVKFLWVGDLDGDGEYDYVLDRQTSPQTIEAYRRNGQFLWSVNMGPNSTNQNNIEGGSSTINVGHNDGVTVYDFDSDGRAEVAVRIANGVRFGNGTTYNALPDNTRQSIAILDGMTGAPRAIAPVPTDYLTDGPMYARFGVGHLDGVNPSLVAYMKNRIGNGGFNLMFCAWRFNGSTLTQQWKFLRGNQDLPDGHNTRIVDVDVDGRDEIAEIGFVLNGNGTLKYSLAPQGIIHGDRFHIAKMDPSRPGLQGYGVQQVNPSGLREYYYDAATGSMIWRHIESGTSDVGRGMVGDIDPRHPGMEVWSFSGLYNAPTNRLAEPNTSLRPWPHLGLWWDGDITMELLNDGKFEKWNPSSPTPTNSVPRLLANWTYGAVNAYGGPNPTFHGDILGDWREEVVYTNSSYNELIIFTTNYPTNTRLYTLAHNPAYRNAMTLKGYVQSHHVDYFLGAGMTPPPRPNITYAGN